MAKKHNAIPGGGTGRNSAYLFRDKSSYRSLKDRQKNSQEFGAKVFGTEGNIAGELTGTSIFDPVLCEIIYRWFCPAGGRILDPFAGGSVRGLVAALLGFDYVGIDLMAGQIAANEQQAQNICRDKKPTWIVGDSRYIEKIVTDPVDLIFSCPPYFDLERYSGDSADVSNALDYNEFIGDYFLICRQSCVLLKENRFACFVVGDIRDRLGFYRGFVSDTIKAFEQAGARLYNEAILITALGSLPIRAGYPFAKFRKLGKTHQNVLIFYKGDPQKIPDQLGMLGVVTDDPGATVQRGGGLSTPTPTPAFRVTAK